MESGIKNIIEKIREKTNNQINDIKNEYEKKLNEKKLELENLFEKEREALLNKYELSLKIEKDRILSKLEIDKKNVLLSKKQEIITEILEMVKYKISNFDKEKIVEYINENIKNLNLENTVLYLPKKYEEIKEKINHSNILLKDMEEGFILESNGIMLNYTLSSKLKYLTEDIEILIQKELFD